MATLLRLGPVLLRLGCLGCSGSVAQTDRPVDPNAVEALRAHWVALQRRDWRAAHDRLHPVLNAKFTLKKFTDFHAKRRKSGGIPQAIDVVSSEGLGDDVIVSFDALYAPPEGGPAVPVPPRRRATLRKSGGSWCLMTPDVLAIGPCDRQVPPDSCLKASQPLSRMLPRAAINRARNRSQGGEEPTSRANGSTFDPSCRSGRQGQRIG
jgi:hypothetical protein